MNHCTSSTENQVIPYDIDDSDDQLSAYGGLPAFKEVWQQIEGDVILDQANVRYGQNVNKVPDLSFLLLSTPFVNADSQRRVAQRFGGEASVKEADPLLVEQTDYDISQRTLNRFANKDRYDWLEVQAARVQHMQQLQECKMNRKGVVILDDWPLIKAFASKMPYISPIWDNNLKRSLPGYAIVHLYYYHPYLKSYSLGMYPWLKKSLTDEKKSKNKARRPAKEDEEKNKMDIALVLIDKLLAALHFAAIIFDNWYTARWFGHELTQRDHVWIGDADVTQKFDVSGQYLSVPEIYEQYRHKLQSVSGQKKAVKAIELNAIIRPNAYTKVAQPVKLVVVTGLHKPRDNDKGYKVLVCNCRHYRLRRIVRLFTNRPQIESVHRNGKQNAGWLDFHSRSVQSLLCHLTFCMFRTDCLTWLQRSIPAARDFSIRQCIDYCLQVTIRLVYRAGKGWIPLLKPDEPLWTFYRRTQFFYR